jgi:hypothetical protein
MKDTLWLSQTELGKMYGVSCVVIGNWLKEVGWRCPDGTPSQEAFLTGVVSKRESRNNGYFYVWSKHDVINIFQDILDYRLPQANAFATAGTKKVGA